MASNPSSSAEKQIPRGTHHPAGEGDLRGPCPMINCLANHGYLPRDGRNVQAEDFFAALSEINLSGSLQSAMARPLYAERPDAEHPAPKSFLSKIWGYASSPWTFVFPTFAVRPPGNVNAQGKPVINLDHLNVHNAIEHDVSLSRRDFGQGDNHTPQKDLIEGLLAASTDGEYLTIEDLVKYKKQRIETQKRDNKDFNFTPEAQSQGAGEITLILKLLGDGQKIRLDFLRSFFAEERLPVEEGWKKRETSMGIVELYSHLTKVKGLIGYKP